MTVTVATEVEDTFIGRAGFSPDKEKPEVFNAIPVKVADEEEFDVPGGMDR